MKTPKSRIYLEVPSTARENWNRPQMRKKMIAWAIFLFLCCAFCAAIYPFQTTDFRFSPVVDSILIFIAFLLSSVLFFPVLFSSRRISVKSGDIVKVIRVDGSEEEFRA